MGYMGGGAEIFLIAVRDNLRSNRPPLNQLTLTFKTLIPDVVSSGCILTFELTRVVFYG